MKKNWIAIPLFALLFAASIANKKEETHAEFERYYMETALQDRTQIIITATTASVAYTFCANRV